MADLFENIKVGDFVKLNPTVGSDSKREVITVTPEGFKTEDNSFWDKQGRSKGWRSASYFNYAYSWTEEDQKVWQFNQKVSKLQSKVSTLFSKLSLLKHQEGYNEEVFDSLSAHLELLTQTLGEDLYNDPE